MTLMMTSAQVVETSVNVTNNSPSRDYSHLDDQTTQTTETPGFKPFTVLLSEVKGITNKIQVKHFERSLFSRCVYHEHELKKPFRVVSKWYKPDEMAFPAFIFSIFQNTMADMNIFKYLLLFEFNDFEVENEEGKDDIFWCR